MNRVGTLGTKWYWQNHSFLPLFLYSFIHSLISYHFFIHSFKMNFQPLYYSTLDILHRTRRSNSLSSPSFRSFLASHRSGISTCRRFFLGFSWMASQHIITARDTRKASAWQAIWYMIHYDPMLFPEWCGFSFRTLVLSPKKNGCRLHVQFKMHADVVVLDLLAWLPYVTTSLQSK